MKRFILFVALFAMISPAVADTEFGDTVPRAFVEALLGPVPFGEARLYSDILDAFPDFDLPAGFEVLGSADRGYALTAVLRTDLDETEAIDALNESLQADGYTLFEVPNMMRSTQTGFINANTPAITSFNRLCHDRAGYITLSHRAGADFNTVSLGNSPLNSRQTCAQELAEQTMMMSRSQAMGSVNLNQYLPRLELPEGDDRRWRPLGFSSSSSNSGVETRASLDSEWDLREVFDHFKVQIEEQDWQLDVENVGSTTATGTWNRSPEPDRELIGTLTVIESDDNRYDLIFSLIRRGGNPGSGGFGVFQAQ